jgi:regulator of protease activity HflC (stomatin/prohibitin superfamily)
MAGKNIGGPSFPSTGDGVLDESVKKAIKIGLRVGLILIGVIIFFSIFYQVRSGEEGVLLTFSRAAPVGINPGLHLKIPFVQSVVRFNMQTQKYGADATQSTLESAASKDLQVVKMRVVLNYHLAQSKAPEVFTNLGTGYIDKVIVPTVHEAAKATTAQFTAINLITDRESVRADIENLLKVKLAPYNIIVEQVSITDFDFSDQFNVAIENKVTAEQNALTEQNKLAVVQFQAQQVVAAANGQRDSSIALAEGQAKATKLNAEAEAYRVQLVQQQLSQSPQYVDYIKASRWNGILPNFYMAGSGSTPLIMSLPSFATTVTNETQ